MDTHYVPPFTHRNGRKQQAVCGVYVRENEIVTRELAPTCPDCLTFVEGAPTREAEDMATADALAQEFPEFENYFLR